MSKLSDFRLLSFDVYGTLIDYRTGVLNALKPALERSGKADLDPKHILATCDELESIQQRETPEMLYSDLLATIYPTLCEKLGLNTPTVEENKAFGDAIGDWPAFADTVEALKRLQKYYKLVVLSNVDNTSFHASRTGSLQGFEFDAVLTAQNIGSYKPDLRNFEYLLKEVKERFGIEQKEVLQTAQSQSHDHRPAKKMGLKSAYIYRTGPLKGDDQDAIFDWKFVTLGEMADAVERESRST